MALLLSQTAAFGPPGVHEKTVPLQGLWVSATQDGASLGICLPQSFSLCLHSASGIDRKWVWGRPSAAQKRLLWPRIIWGLGGNVGFGRVLEEKGDKIIIWVSWFRKDSQITDCWSTYFTSMNFCSKRRMAWKGSCFKANWQIDWLILQWLPQKMLLLHGQHKAVLCSFHAS